MEYSVVFRSQESSSILGKQGRYVLPGGGCHSQCCWERCHSSLCLPRVSIVRGKIISLSFDGKNLANTFITFQHYGIIFYYLSVKRISALPKLELQSQTAVVLLYEEVVFNSGFLLLADHYDFLAGACRPLRARTKGKVERMVKYPKENVFVRYRRFDSFAHVNNSWSSGWLTLLINRSFASLDRRWNRSICSRCRIRTPIPVTRHPACVLGPLYRGWRQSLRCSRNPEWAAGLDTNIAE